MNNRTASYLPNKRTPQTNTPHNLVPSRFSHSPRDISSKAHTPGARRGQCSRPITYPLIVYFEPAPLGYVHIYLILEYFSTLCTALQCHLQRVHTRVFTHTMGAGARRAAANAKYTTHAGFSHPRAGLITMRELRCRARRERRKTRRAKCRNV